MAAVVSQVSQHQVLHTHLAMAARRQTTRSLLKGLGAVSKHCDKRDITRDRQVVLEYMDKNPQDVSKLASICENGIALTSVLIWLGLTCS